MTFFNELSNKLFPKKSTETSTGSFPVVHEIIHRSQTYLNGYNAWKGGPVQQESLEFILAQFHNQLAENDYSPLFSLVQAETTRGFMLRAWQGLSGHEFSYLFDYLAERVRDMGYTFYTSDRRLHDKEDGVLCIERHYLKPSWRIAPINGKINQLSGNTTIELHILNNQMQHIKFVCQPYQDAKFHTAAPFADMVCHICKT
jgi:hypothetical protein